MPARDALQSIYWGSHLAGHAPLLAVRSGTLALANRVRPKSLPVKILVGTHHKVLTVFLGRVFRVFGKIANHGFSQGQGAEVDYGCTILHDHHSAFDMERLDRPFVGIHVVRDPRDVLVSATFYHQTAAEPQLHVPREAFGGKTYQEQLRGLPDMEARLLFELDHDAGRTIDDMLAWKAGCFGFAECKYETLVGPAGSDAFDEAVSSWALPRKELRLLEALFRYFSIDGPGAKGNRHIRKPESGQWRAHFSPRVLAAFEAKYPDALARLGYSP